MPRVPKETKAKLEPLYESYADANTVATKSKNRTKYAEREKRREKKDVDSTFVEPKLTGKILESARLQQEELENEFLADSSKKNHSVSKDHEYSDFPSDELKGKNFKPREIAESYSDSEDDYDENQDYDDYSDLEFQVDAKDAAIFEKLMPSAPQKRQNLADIISAKINEFNKAQAPKNESGNLQSTSGNQMEKMKSQINPKVVQVYTQVGEILSRYKSGPVPKAFKIIPSITNWEQVLYITAPENWTPHAIFQATKIFISNMKPKQAQKFLNTVLLERVRDDISENKKLNYHLYMALKKALYKPAAFFKGILFPLCENDNCTLREAIIISSVLSKVSIPVLHSAAALLHLANLNYSGPTALLIRVLLDKKYALPYKVVDALVFHFTSFATNKSLCYDKHGVFQELPVLWHQSFLVFAQRYKSDIAPDQKDALLQVLHVHYHPQISEEIRRELVNSVCRGEIVVDPATSLTNDVEMSMN
ncbi:Bystin [Smittium mucronatum]|uniref:Bystin n=1 Tax=Smittium mucronatum TaxID=133383 RepID=A0A1R0H5A2_9FUNG|nr:Bystin [Smittium mucronatum]